MTKFHTLVFGIVLLAPSFVTPLQASALALAKQASIQVSIQKHVDGQLVDGVMLYLNQKAGGVQRLHPVMAHPMPLTMGDHYASCFNFRNGNGKKIQV